MEKKIEEYGIVLDFLPNGHPDERITTPIAQVIGDKYFTLLEVTPRKGIILNPGERVYLGSEKRERVHHIVGRIKYDKLTSTAKLELEHVIEELVDKNEKRFVEWINHCGAITTRLHQLELLPGIGKKHMWEILRERERKPFESFDDIKNRLPSIPDIRKAIINRIIMELKGEDKYRVLTG